MIAALERHLTRFGRDENGSYAVEAVLMFPLLIWASLATLSYVEGYRLQNMNQRVTYAMADMLSRQWDPVGPRFVDGLGRVHDHLTDDRNPTFLRVTVAYWNDVDSRHELVWSRATAGAPAAVTEGTLPQIADAIPAMAHGDSAIVVETWMDFEPSFDVGLSAERFYNRVVTSPRFTPQLKFDAAR